MAAFVTPYACALGLGEIQVSSNLGQPLKAQIDVIELPTANAPDIKMRLASIEDYKQNSLQYPEGIKFSFLLVNEPGARPFFRITTTRPLDEPFVNLLIEVSSPGTKELKTYNVLLDPTPDWSRSQMSEPAVQQPVAAESSQPDGTVAQAIIPAPTQIQTPASTHASDLGTSSDSKHPSTAAAPATASLKPVNSTHRSKTHEQIATQTRDDSGTINRNIDHFGKLSMSLSTSLSISKSAPGVSPKENNDALQEELIAKEKTIVELQLRVSEMQALIANLRARITPGAASAVANAAVPATVESGALHAASAVTENAAPKNIPAVTVATAAEPVNGSENIQHYGKNFLLLFGLLIPAGAAIYWYRKRESEQQQSLFDEESVLAEQVTMAETPEPAHAAYAKEAPPAAIERTRSPVPSSELAGAPAPSLSTGGTRESQELSEVDSMLEEAELYAIHGREGRAIEILNDILLEYPDKTEVWLLLLSIFSNKNNARQFESIARKFLFTIGDNEAWKGIQEAGRGIDPDNPLYFDADGTNATNTEHVIKPHKRRLLGEILVDMNAISVSELEGCLANFDHLRDGRFGDYLVASELIRQDQLDAALQQQSIEIAQAPAKITSGANGLHSKVSQPSLIGDVLVQMGIVTEEGLEHILSNYDPRRHGRCGTYLVNIGFVTEKQLHMALLQQLRGAMSVDLDFPTATPAPEKVSDFIPWDMPDRSIR